VTLGRASSASAASSCGSVAAQIENHCPRASRAKLCQRGVDPFARSRPETAQRDVPDVAGKKPSADFRRRNGSPRNRELLDCGVVRVQDVDVHDRAGPAAEHCANGSGRETGARAAVHRDDPVAGDQAGTGRRAAVENLIDYAAAVRSRVHERDGGIGDPTAAQIRNDAGARSVEQALRRDGVIVVIRDRRAAHIELDEIEQRNVATGGCRCRDAHQAVRDKRGGRGAPVRYAVIESAPSSKTRMIMCE
jgi:hypothetical protein